MPTIDRTLTANKSEPIHIKGGYIYLVDAPTGYVTVEIGNQRERLREGQGIKLADRESSVEAMVTSEVNQSVTFFIGKHEFIDNRVVGEVDATPVLPDTLTNGKNTSTAVNQNYTIAANANRKKITIYNLDDSLLGVGGSGLGSFEGVLLLAGDSVVIENTGAVVIRHTDNGSTANWVEET